MAAPYVPNTAYMYFQCACNGKDVGFGYNCEFLSGLYDQTAIDDLADIGNTWFTDEIMPITSITLSYIQTVVRGLNSAIDLTATNNNGASNGLSNNAPLPNNVSFVIKHSTGFTGRSARGRSYMVGIPNNVVAANEDDMGVTQAQAYVDAFDLLDATLDAAGWNGVVVSRYTAGVLRTTPITTTITGHEFTDLKLDTRRKRLG